MWGLQTSKQGHMVKVRKDSFWVSEAYELSGGIGDSGAREEGTVGPTDKQTNINADS